MLQGHTRWTGTHGEMISSDLHGAKSHQMDVEIPARGRDRSWDCTRERGGRSTKDILEGLDPRGSFPPTMMLALEGPRCHLCDP